MIGRRLRDVRDGLGLSQREAAAAAGMPHQYLSNLETGRIANPSIQTLTRLAAAYGVGVGDLVGRGAPYELEELPEGLRELMADADWGEQITPPWVETLMDVGLAGRRLQTKREFLEAYLALRRILEDAG